MDLYTSLIRSLCACVCLSVMVHLCVSMLVSVCLSVCYHLAKNEQAGGPEALCKYTIKTTVYRIIKILKVSRDRSLGATKSKETKKKILAEGTLKILA